ncbi:MAG: Ribosome small subunit-stimulated GTPase EngC [uncultured Thiotrichaceae bacterium]|uniref:Small ribosomal subunit biogenesis GTPase RsgA n=1 Tax=uncultured Thiotrichaceae bacterium TaxID=298394 RepID=A0A6S6SMK6_9GAMM|nr:MAG: Ribosome small subunit-stimulated GTPase EngC [uncultured Thiotrichaceae bacterium]
MDNKARVIIRYGADVVVRTPEGEHIRCTAKRKFEHIACGDYVDIEEAKQGNAKVVTLHKRKNALIRPDYSGRPKTIAANIDQVVIISSWHPDPPLELIDRYLVTADALDADAIIVFNKSDLAESAKEKTQKAIAEYASLGFPLIHSIASDTAHQQGIKNLQSHLQDKTSILVGQSGVGKSSIAQLILPDQTIKVGEVAYNGEGKHTTTTTNLYDLPSGGFLIDSPGVRDFVLHEINQQQLQAGFKEFGPFAAHCKFSNCSHQHEPKCAVKAAYEAGDIPPFRYRRYLNMISTL